MHLKLTIAAFAGVAALAAGPASARPYLMLSADNRGFQALDLGGMNRDREGLVEVTLIDAPLAGASYQDKLAPMVQRRVEVSCTNARWRTLSAAYVDAREKVLATDPAPGDWRFFDEGGAGPVVQSAACEKKFRQEHVSRYLNIGEVLANYQAAWGKAAPEHLTEKELAAKRYADDHKLGMPTLHPVSP